MSLEVERLAFSYPKRGAVLTDVTLSLGEGEALALLGPNGTGKTTLLRCLLGINRFQHGKVQLDGRDMRSLTRRELASSIAYVPQATNAIFPYRIVDMVLMGRTPHIGLLATPSKQDERIARDALEKLGIVHLADRFFGEISGGERQMTLIARAITQQSSILILDEPTASLDFGNQIRILKIIRELSERGYSILMTTHFPNHAFLSCNKVALIKGGTIRAIGDPEEIVTDENLSDLYSVPITVVSISLPDSRAKSVKVCVPILA